MVRALLARTTNVGLLGVSLVLCIPMKVGRIKSKLGSIAAVVLESNGLVIWMIIGLEGRQGGVRGKTGGHWQPFEVRHTKDAQQVAR
jgi:hypothetical protein